MKKILLCLILGGCQMAGQTSTPIQSEQKPEWMQNLSECAGYDKGSILWLDHFKNDVLADTQDKYDSAKKLCSKSKVFKGKKMTEPMFLYNTYKQDMSEKCKNAVSEFIKYSDNKVCGQTH